MTNALTGYYDVGKNALATAGRQLDPMTGLYFDPSDSSGALYDASGNRVWDTSAYGPDLAGPWGHPQLNPATQGTSQYGPLQNPYLPNYVNIGGVPFVDGDYAQAEGVASYNRGLKHLDDDQFALGNPGSVAFIPMLAAGLTSIGSGAAGGGTSGYASHLASASDAAYGSTAAGGGGSSLLNGGFGLSAGAGGAPAAGSLAAPASGGGFFSSLFGGGSGGGMGLGIKDWLNIGDTVLGAYGANRAADAQSNSSDAAINEYRRQFDINQANQAPYQAAGVKALGNLNDPQASFQASPGYAFRRSEGQRDVGNYFGARGGAASGNALRALTEFNQNLASGEFGNWWNQQAGLAGVGQTANAQSGAYGQAAANGIGNALQNQGDARATGIAGAYGAVNNGISNYLYGRRGQNPYQRP